MHTIVVVEGYGIFPWSTWVGGGSGVETFAAVGLLARRTVRKC